MKSFKLYVVFLMIIGIAVGCADENRAFKPKSVLAGIKANGKSNSLTPEVKDDDQTKKDAGKTEKDTGATPPAKLDDADQKVLDRVNTPVEDFKNNNQPNKDAKTTVTTTTNGETANGGKPADAATKAAAAQMTSSDEEAAYFADAEKRNSAYKTILGVSVSRGVVAEGDSVKIEVLSYIKFGEQHETIVSKGNLFLPAANEKLGSVQNLNSIISRQDRDYSMDDYVKVQAQCSELECAEVTLKVTVKMDVKNGDKVDKVYAVSGYSFAVPKNAQPKAGMLFLRHAGVTFGKENFKYYEDSLGWTNGRPSFDDEGKIVPAAATTGTGSGKGSLNGNADSGAGASLSEQEKEALAQGQTIKNKEVGSTKESTVSELDFKDPYEQMETSRATVAKQLAEKNTQTVTTARVNDSGDVEHIGQVSAKTRSSNEMVGIQVNQAMNAREAEAARVADLESGERLGSVSKSGKRQEPVGKYGKDYAGVDYRGYFEKKYDGAVESMVKARNDAYDYANKKIDDGIDTVKGWFTWGKSETKTDGTAAVKK